MYGMLNCRSKTMRLLLWFGLCSLGTVFTSCSRQEPFQPSVPSTAMAASPTSIGGSSLPFHPESETIAVGSPSNATASMAGVAVKPFGSRTRSEDVLPTGTLISVRLRGSLSAANVHPGDRFSATLADPLIVDGRMFADSGSPITGVVQSAREEEEPSGRRLGYFELTLLSADMNGQKMPLRTSSLFARATSQPNLSTSVRIQKGHRLTFRLTAPISVNAEVSPQPTTAALSGALRAGKSPE